MKQQSMCKIKSFGNDYFLSKKEGSGIITLFTEIAINLFTSSPTRKFLNQSRYDNFQNWLEV